MAALHAASTRRSWRWIRTRSAFATPLARRRAGSCFRRNGPGSLRALDAIEQANPGLPGHWCELAADVAEGAGDRSRAAALLLEAGRRALDGGAHDGGDDVGASAGARRRGTPSPSTSRTPGHGAGAGRQTRPAVEVGSRSWPSSGRSGARPPASRGAPAPGAPGGGDPLGRGRRAPGASVGRGGRPCRRRAAGPHRRGGRPGGDHAAARGRVVLARRPRRGRAARPPGWRARRWRSSAGSNGSATSTRPRPCSRAHEIADGHGRACGACEALHELGTIDLLRGGGLDRFEQARELALALGALSTVAVLDVQISAALAIGDDPEPSLAVARRATELARRYRLGAARRRVGVRGGRPRPGRPPDRAGAMPGRGERARRQRLRRHRRVRPGPARVRGGGPGRRPPPPRAGRGRVAAGVRRPGHRTGGGALALVLAVDDGDMDHWPAHEPVHFLARASSATPRPSSPAGRAMSTTLGLLLQGDEALADVAWFRHCAHRLVAEAALADGWGDPVAWLTDALRFFDRNGDERLASACRSLLRKAGAPVPRAEGRGGGVLGVAAGVGAHRTGARGSPSARRGAVQQGHRCPLVPFARTVERHVASLTAKAGVSRRSELVAFAARSVGPN